MGAFRGASVLLSFLALTLPLMPVQALLVRSGSKRARTFPHWYHRQVCRLLGIRLHIEGQVDPKRPVLLIANHSTWLDIPVLSAVAPLSFVAKREVSTWPFVSSLARLQRTVFVDRTRRTAVGQTAGEITQRLSAGDTIVLFAEGTSSDGNRVLPFMTSLFAAAKPAARDAAEAEKAGAQEKQAVVQTLSAVYTHLHGIPVGRDGRPRIAWYGDMEMRSHAWELLKAGPLDVTIRISPPVPLTSFADRKELARHSEAQVREGVVRILRGRPSDEPVAVVAPETAQSAVRSRLAGQAGQDGRKWT